MNQGVHVFLAIALAMAAGAALAAIAGFLKAAVGAHEVITTIMLNWIVYWVGSFLFGRGGPLQNTVDVAIPASNEVTPSAHLPAFWGNPEAARYGGINVSRNYVYAMAISGAFAGLGGAMDVLGWQYSVGVLDIQ